MHPKKMTIAMKHVAPHKTKKKINLEDDLQDK